MYGLVGQNENSKLPFPIVSRIDGNHLATECTNSNRWPACKLNGRPTFKLQPHMSPRFDEWSVIAIQPNLHRPISRIGYDDTNGISNFQNFAALVGSDSCHESVKRSVYRLVFLASQLVL